MHVLHTAPDQLQLTALGDISAVAGSTASSQLQRRADIPARTRAEIGGPDTRCRQHAQLPALDELHGTASSSARELSEALETEQALMAAWGSCLQHARFVAHKQAMLQRLCCSSSAALQSQRRSLQDQDTK